MAFPTKINFIKKTNEKEQDAYHKENAAFQVCGREIDIIENPQLVDLKGGNGKDRHTLEQKPCLDSSEVQPKM